MWVARYGVLGRHCVDVMFSAFVFVACGWARCDSTPPGAACLGRFVSHSSGSAKLRERMTRVVCVCITCESESERREKKKSWPN
ncbi:uncharacterized protein K452DRAFT_116244 [Aplosporella prunicola CBS 121167]|uniref:Secreted protein n=1 Tax=Aplosporella prunicola CBS 121167 TaxID=1176127 RepID=A0A6A6B0K9_9PEZI|nr:uncharacterized protein K452DRAFT_116244 [Aplosporella prunicola CBS 121167]KAF2136973.1 hypothetical protein K452DRAFT_116244 [Aplosporella prunicola CBS 121167]